MKHTLLLGFSLVSLGLTSCKTTQPTEFQSFFSDGCTGFPDGPKTDPELWCVDCQYHDFLYWRGGTFADRKIADKILRDDLREKGFPVAAGVAYLGVRAFGSPYLPTPWRWGYGWKQFPRGYGPLTSLEEKTISEQVSSVPVELLDREEQSSQP